MQQLTRSLTLIAQEHVAQRGRGQWARWLVAKRLQFASQRPFRRAFVCRRVAEAGHCRPIGIMRGEKCLQMGAFSSREP